MDEEQPKKKITLNNFFESIQSADGKANRALKKSSSNLDLIKKNKSLIEGLRKGLKDIKSKVELIQKSILDKKDIEEDKLFVQEDQEQKIRRLERLQGIEGDKVDPADNAAGTTDDSEFEKKAAETVKKAIQNPDIVSIFAGLIGLSVAGLMGAGANVVGDVKKRTFSEKTGGFLDFLTDDLTDFDRRGVDEKTGAGKPKTYGKFLGGAVDFFTANMFDLDKSGDFFRSREEIEEMEKIIEFNKERKKVGLDPIKLNLGGEVKDNDNDTSNNNEDSVPAILTPGEFVVTKDAVDKVGVDTLKGLNASVGATNKPTLMEGTTDSYLASMSKEFAGFNEDGSMKTIDKTMRMTDEGLEKTYFDGNKDIYELTGDNEYLYDKTEMIGSGMSSETIQRYNVDETYDDGSKSTLTGEHKLKSAVVSIGVPDLIEHQDQLLREIHKLKGFENITIEDVLNSRTGIPKEKYLPILMRSDASKATRKKQDRAKKLDDEAGVNPFQSDFSFFEDPLPKDISVGYRRGQVTPTQLVVSKDDLTSKEEERYKYDSTKDTTLAKGFNQGGLVEGVKKMYSSEIEKNKSKNNLKPLLDMIGSGESDNVGGYTAMFPSESYPKMLDMTINEVIEFQKEKLKDGRKSVAVGRYQMLYPEDYAAAAGLPLTAKFTPENQDKMVIAYLKKNRKLNEFIKGEITNEQFSEELSQEFGTFKSASGFVLPNNTGSIDFPMMVPVLNKIKNNLKPETKSSDNLQSVIESKSDQLAQNIFTPPTTQSNNVNLLPIPITQQQSQPINGNVPVSAPQVIPQVSTTPVTSTMSTVSFINMISNKQLSVG